MQAHVTRRAVASEHKHSPCVPSAEVVKNLDIIAQLQQPCDQIRSDEARTASNHHCLMTWLCSYCSRNIAAAVGHRWQTYPSHG